MIIFKHTATNTVQIRRTKKTVIIIVNVSDKQDRLLTLAREFKYILRIAIFHIKYLLIRKRIKHR